VPLETKDATKGEAGLWYSSRALPHCSSWPSDVELPLGYRGVPRRARRERAQAALERVGLGHRLEHTPTRMSGGERQRVAVARALVGAPSLVLADEPTGNLDTVTGEGILDLLREIHAGGATVIVVTHDPQVAARAPRRVTLRDGRIEGDERDRDPRGEARA
jgi:putative ABC transport system ATP-binding protein